MSLSYIMRLDLIEQVELFRIEADQKLNPATRGKLGQFLTAPVTADLIASMFSIQGEAIHLLDAGAGVGTLTAAFISRLLRLPIRPKSVQVTAFEIDPILTSYLKKTLEQCSILCNSAGVNFSSRVIEQDFIENSVTALQYQGTLFSSTNAASYTCAILNPPYCKINSETSTRHLLRSIGIETSNLYAAFVWLSLMMLKDNGELVAITPRSFCNGPYFKPFRKYLLSSSSLQRVHVFDARDKAFQLNDVLQENIIFHVIKAQKTDEVEISSSNDPQDPAISLIKSHYRDVIKPGDSDLVIHLPTDGLTHGVTERINTFKYTLRDLGIAVSTGRVVDFRSREYLQAEPKLDSYPLIYPGHFENGTIVWPKIGGKKPNGLAKDHATLPLTLPTGYYCLVRRFSSKEEPRRIVSALFDPKKVVSPHIGFENHLNVFHQDNQGLDELVAKGLAIYLNSTLVDMYFRNFNGHTQVNASDLRSLTYPDTKTLRRLGMHFVEQLPTQAEIDSLINQEIRAMSDNLNTADPVQAKAKVEEAIKILNSLGFPKAQLNERSALTLLALLNLTPEKSWTEIETPLMGITPIMEFARKAYGKAYAPNTRETVRRQTMHQFVEAGLAVANPDKPQRETNSPKSCYQIEPRAYQLLRNFGTAEWDSELDVYLATVVTLRERYARERDTHLLPLKIADTTEIYLTPGEHNELAREVLNEFVPRFVPNSEIIYVGDTGKKWAYFNEDLLADLGVTVEAHGKMPDVVIYFPEKNWLLLIEVVTSHGPVDGKRRLELERLFAGATPGIVYVTAFKTRSEMARYLPEISWETEVWVSEDKSHLIHFNGERFLGPYE